MNSMITGYRWEANWKILLFVLLVVPILIKLGFWQLERAEEKTTLQERYAKQQMALPVPLSTLNSSDKLAYKPVQILSLIHL